MKNINLLLLLIISFNTNCLSDALNRKIHVYSISNYDSSKIQLIHEDEYCAFFVPIFATGMKKEILLDIYLKYKSTHDPKRIIIKRSKKYEWICNHYYKIEVYDEI